MSLERIGIVGDIHAETIRLEIALHFLHKKQVDCILCVGDVVDGLGNVDACCELLRENEVLIVRGNHDRWFTESDMRDLPEATQGDDVSATSKSFIKLLPPTRTLETIAGRLLLCHGLGANDMQRLTADDYGYALEVMEELHTLIRNREYQFVVNGHTHRRMVRQFKHLSIINAGTLYYAHNPCIAIADFQANQVQFYDFQEHDLVQSSELEKIT
jgi:putative phosphoesterase